MSEENLAGRSQSGESVGLRCRACGHQQAGGLVCQECGAPLLGEQDYFSVFGLRRVPVVELAELERVYHQLERVVHPDRFATAPAAVRAASLQASALINRAYRVLRDPVARGRYWLELHGEKLGQNNQNVPIELSELVFEVQEEIEEVRAVAKSTDRGSNGDLRRALETRRDEIAQLVQQANSALEDNFASWDADLSEDRRGALLADLKAILSRIAYLQTLLRDIDRALAD